MYPDSVGFPIMWRSAGSGRCRVSRHHVTLATACILEDSGCRRSRATWSHGVPMQSTTPPRRSHYGIIHRAMKVMSPRFARSAIVVRTFVSMTNSDPGCVPSPRAMFALRARQLRPCRIPSHTSIACQQRPSVVVANTTRPTTHMRNGAASSHHHAKQIIRRPVRSAAGRGTSRALRVGLGAPWRDTEGCGRGAPSWRDRSGPWRARSMRP